MQIRNSRLNGDPTNVQWYKDTSIGFVFFALLFLVGTFTETVPVTGAETCAIDSQGHVVPTSTVTGAVTERDGAYYLIGPGKTSTLIAHCTGGKLHNCYGPVTQLHDMRGAELQAELCRNTAMRLVKSGKQIYRLHILDADERRQYVRRMRFVDGAIATIGLALAFFFYLEGKKAHRLASILPAVQEK
jgi:hypothetical protein